MFSLLGSSEIIRLLNNMEGILSVSLFCFTVKPFSSLSPKKTTQPGQPNGCRMVGIQFSSLTRRVADLAVGEQARVRKLAQRERKKTPKRN